MKKLSSLVLMILMSSSAHANICHLISDVQAKEALIAIKRARTVHSFCPTCVDLKVVGKKRLHYKEVPHRDVYQYSLRQVSAIDARESALDDPMQSDELDLDLSKASAVNNNDGIVDLAYTYVDGKNLAYLLGMDELLRGKSIPRELTEAQIKSAKPY